jgi:hypothetical protein
MQTNVGQADQVIRLMIGTLLLTMSATGQLGLFGWIGGFLTLGSGTFGICALYSLLGLSTCRVDALDSQSASANTVNISNS